MKLYGYGENGEYLTELSEVSIDCNVEEIQSFIDFFTKVKFEHESVKNKTDMCHSHFKDYIFSKDTKTPDIIIVTKFE